MAGNDSLLSLPELVTYLRAVPQHVGAGQLCELGETPIINAEVEVFVEDSEILVAALHDPTLPLHGENGPTWLQTQQDCWDEESDDAGRSSRQLQRSRFAKHLEVLEVPQWYLRVLICTVSAALITHQWPSGCGTYQSPIWWIFAAFLWTRCLCTSVNYKMAVQIAWHQILHWVKNVQTRIWRQHRGLQHFCRCPREIFSWLWGGKIYAE